MLLGAYPLGLIVWWPFKNHPSSLAYAHTRTHTLTHTHWLLWEVLPTFFLRPREQQLPAPGST